MSNAVAAKKTTKRFIECVPLRKDEEDYHHAQGCALETDRLRVRALRGARAMSF
ncbi:MAG: hypothetical protein NVSMB68_00110 [Thermoanaerobaculia bacterium]